MTLASFTKNLLNHFTCRAIINVDPVGDTAKHSQMDVVEVCREYFDVVVQRTPESPSFAGAVQWCWRQVETDLFFHLEDDWILRREIDPNELVGLFKNGRVVGATLNRRNRKEALATLERENKPAIFHTNLYVNYPEVSLNPSLFRKAYLQSVANRMGEEQDPEYQASKLTANDSELFLWRITETPVLIDTGKYWRRSRNIIKSKSDQQFSSWRPAKPPALLRQSMRILKWQIRKCFWQIRYCN